ncbi:MAG: hypothetical protein IKS55_15085 [Oscillospiraceae bacterium]|nr:hypothetical protein [Oscillospiraceae bacterium]
MCKAFEEVRNESFSRGMQQGMQQKEISNIKTLMESMNWSAQNAMEALRIPAEDQPKYAEMLSV